MPWWFALDISPSLTCHSETSQVNLRNAAAALAPTQQMSHTVLSVNVSNGGWNDWQIFIFSDKFSIYLFLIIPGIESFRAKYFHNWEYCSAEGLEGKRVVVIGIGNSGGDIAVDVSRVAEKVSCCATFLYFYVVFKKNSDVYEYESTVFLKEYNSWIWNLLVLTWPAGVPQYQKWSMGCWPCRARGTSTKCCREFLNGRTDTKALPLMDQHNVGEEAESSAGPQTIWPETETS